MRVKIGTSTRTLSTRNFFTSDFLELPNLGAANTAPAEGLELLSGDSSARADSNCYHIEMMGQGEVWLGWRNDRFSVRVNNIATWLSDSSRLELWILGG